jgi:hypothetical protein
MGLISSLSAKTKIKRRILGDDDESDITFRVRSTLLLK